MLTRRITNIFYIGTGKAVILNNNNYFFFLFDFITRKTETKQKI